MFFLSISLVVGCGTEPVAEPVSVKEVVVPREPNYDLRLSTPEMVAAWKQETLKLAEKIENPPDIAMYDAMEAKFVVDASVVPAFLDAIEPVYERGEPNVYKYETPVVEKPTAESAKQLEVARQHMDAGIQYATLGDKTSAARCVKALEQKGEWNAAALVAYEAGDKPKLFAMLDKMAERDDWDDRRRAIVSRAIADKKMAFATEIATHCGWDITKGDWDKDLLATGDAKVTRAVNERQVTRWIEEVSEQCRDENNVVQCGGPVGWYGDDQLEAMLVTYAKQDKAGAFALAKIYFDSRYSSPACNLELYKLVRGDAALKASFLGKVRAIGTTYAQPYNNEGDWEMRDMSPEVSFRCLQSVKALGDKDLTAGWSGFLDGVAQYGVDPYCYRSDCRPDSSYAPKNATRVALGRLILGVPYGSFAAIDPVHYGTISAEAITAVWVELGLPVPDASLTLEKVSEALDSALSLNYKGFEAEALKTAQAVLGAAAPEKISDCLNLLGLYREYLLIPSEAPKSDYTASGTIRGRIDAGRAGFDQSRRDDLGEFFKNVFFPETVAHTNDREQREVAYANGVQQSELDTVFPVTQAEASDLIVSMFTELQGPSPKAYSAAIYHLVNRCDRGRDFCPMEGDRLSIDAEVKRLTESGNAETLQGVLAMLPYDYKRQTRY